MNWHLKDRKNLPVRQKHNNDFSLQSRINHFFNDFLEPFNSVDFLNNNTVLGLTEPKLDMIETQTSYEIKVELSGVQEKDIDISCENGTLFIKGEKKEENYYSENKNNYHYKECSYGSFSRAVTMPVDIDASKITAFFKNGILTLNIPKIKNGFNFRRRIPVNKY